MGDVNVRVLRVRGKLFGADRKASNLEVACGDLLLLSVMVIIRCVIMPSLWCQRLLAAVCLLLSSRRW